MNLILNFFAALSECFCDTFPETLTVYKSLLTDRRAQLEVAFGEYILANAAQILSRDPNLPPIELGEGLPQISLSKILHHPIGIQNDSSIWAHLEVLCNQYCPAIQHQQKTPVDMINSLIDKISANMTPLETIDGQPSKPEDLFKNLFNSNVFGDIISQVQQEMAQNPHLTPQDLVMAAAQVLTAPPS